jgi:flagellar protein FliO/FliZ
MTTADPESISWLRILMAFAIVFGLMGLLAYGLKYISTRGIKLPGMTMRNQRLHIVESMTLDVRRRLVIVRRDDVEHLLLLGVNQDIVVESDLTRNQPAATTSAI